MAVLGRALLLAVVVLLCSGTPTGPGLSRLGLLARLESLGCGEEKVSGAAGCFLKQSVTAELRRETNSGSSELVFAFSSSSNNQIPLTETFPLTEDSNDSEEADFLSGKWFILVRSDSCPSGVLRGQLDSENNAFASLDGDSLPSPTKSTAQGLSVSNYDTETGVLDTFLQFVVQDEVAEVQITSSGNPSRGQSRLPEKFVFAFPDRVSPVTGPLPLTSKPESQLYHQEFYYEVVSKTSPVAEIGGKIQMLDSAPEANFAFLLTDLEQKPQGCALLSLLCSGEVEYIVSYAETDLSQAVVVVRDTNEVLFELNGLRSPLIGRRVLTSEEIKLLISGDLSIVINSASGTATGKIQATFPYFAYFSGSQSVPRTTTFARGCAVFNVNKKSTTVEYHFFHNAGNAQVALHLGDFGVSGPLIASLSSPSGSFEVTASQLESLFLQETYLAVTGEKNLRGQVLFASRSCFQAESGGFDVLDLFSRDTNNYYSTDPYFSLQVAPSSTLQAALLFAGLLWMF